MSESIVPDPEIDETKILKLLALTGLGRRLLPINWIGEDGRCSCMERESDEDTRVCSRNKPGKHPRVSQWQTKASTESVQILQWHSWMPLANWGWVQDETFALDVDPKRGGLESLAQWEQETGGPWPTLTQRTQSGGYHFIYRQPENPLRVQGDILPGIEIRGLGSYIMIEPSVGLDGRWEFIDPGKAPAEADEDTLQLIHRHGLLLELDTRAGGGSGRRESGEKSTLPATEHFIEKGFGGVSGSRNVDAYRLTWRLLAQMDRYPEIYTPATVLARMRKCWLATEQGEDMFTWEECVGAMRSAWRRRERQTRETNAELLARAQSLVAGGR